MAVTGANLQAPTFRVMYRSHSLLPADRRDSALAEIFSQARSNNKKAGITGALLLTDHYFVQVLEGDESVVLPLYERIRADDRHDDVILLESTTVEGRVFAKWAMARVSSSGHADIPLHAEDGGLHPAAESPVTREQYAVLATMRNTIGADTV